MITPVLTFWWRLLATLAVEGCCLAALGFAAQRLARSTYWRRAAWQITLVCLLAAAVSEWTGVGRALAAHFAPRPQVVENIPVPTVGFVARGEPLEVQSVALPPPPPPEKQPGAVWWPGVIGLAGTVLWLGRTALAQGLLLALRFGRNRITDGPLLERLARLSPRLGLRRKVSLRRMPTLMSPMAFGLWRPCIGLPAQFETKFSPAEQDAVLAHELAHLAARDPFWFLLADLAAAALWWHPAAWWARQRLHVLSEQAADEATAFVPDGPKALAQCLVALGKEMADMGAWGWVGVNGGGFRSNLGRRVEGLLQLSGGPPRPLSGRGAGAAKIAAMLAIAPLTVVAFGSMQTTQGPSDETWRSQFEESWHQSPAGVLLLAKRDDPPPHETNQVDKAAPLPAAIPKEKKLQNAKLLYEMGRYNEAETMLQQILKDDPANRSALYYLDLIKEARYMERARRGPATNNQTAANPNHSNIQIAAMVQDAKFLYEMHKLDEAETIFQQVLKDDPSNRSAPYFLDLIKEAPYMNGGIREGQFSMWSSNLVYTSKGKQRILSKLNTIMFDEVSCDLPLKEVLSRLRAESQKRDPDGIGVNFMINQMVDVSAGSPSPNVPNGATAAAPPLQDMASVMIRISKPLKNIRLMDVLDAITKVADKPIRYTVEDYAVVFSSKPAETNALYIKKFRVNPNTFMHALENVSSVTTNGATVKVHEMIRAYFAALGFDLSPPKMIFFNDRLGELLVRGASSDLDVIEKGVELLNQSPTNNPDFDSIMRRLREKRDQETH